LLSVRGVSKTLKESGCQIDHCCHALMIGKRFTCFWNWNKKLVGYQCNKLNHVTRAEWTSATNYIYQSDKISSKLNHFTRTVWNLLHTILSDHIFRSVCRVFHSINLTRQYFFLYHVQVYGLLVTAFLLSKEIKKETSRIQFENLMLLVTAFLSNKYVQCNLTCGIGESDT
jgi:hypothetical protein